MNGIFIRLYQIFSRRFNNRIKITTQPVLINELVGSFVHMHWEETTQKLFVLNKKPKEKEKIYLTCFANWDKKGKPVFEIPIDVSHNSFIPKLLRYFSGFRKYPCYGIALNHSSPKIDFVSFGVKKIFFCFIILLNFYFYSLKEWTLHLQTKYDRIARRNRSHHFGITQKCKT